MNRVDVNLACDRVLGTGVYQNLMKARMGLPCIAEMAARRAFLHGVVNEVDEDVLRQYLLALEQEGYVLFEGEEA